MFGDDSELGDTESAIVEWASGPVSGYDAFNRGGCTCGHWGLGPAWHGSDCPWALAAWRGKCLELARWCDGKGNEP